MESVRTVTFRLFADIPELHATTQEWESLDDQNAQNLNGLFNKNPSKRRRLRLLHPNTSFEANTYDNVVFTHTSASARIDYDSLTSDFLKACHMTGGNVTEQLKKIILKYREGPITLEKATRLITFLHHVLKVIPISAATFTSTPVSGKLSFPLGTMIEDLTLTLTTQQPSIWILTVQFILSCLRNTPQQQIHSAGITAPVILSVIKHILLEMTRLPCTQMTTAQEKCFAVGRALLDLFLIRTDNATDTSESAKFIGIGAITYYDVLYSFPELYGHFLNTAPNMSANAATRFQPSIANHNIWQMTLNYLTVSIMQDHRLVDRIPTLMAINIIKHILREINTLPADLTTIQVDCINKGKELINLLLLGVNGDGAGVVSQYDIIVALPDVYGIFQHGTFAQSVHWAMEKFINELGKRRRHLAFLMMPPDASWPLISLLSRRHEYNDLTTRTSYHMFEGDLIEYVKEGSSTNIETHFRDMLFQRASMDEFRQLAMSLTQTGLDTTLIRKAMVAKIRDVIRCMQHFSRTERNEDSDVKMSDNSISTPTQDDNVTMRIPDNFHLWELMIETADQLYSFVSAEFFTYEDILNDIFELIYRPNGEPHMPGVRNYIAKDNGLIWLLLQLFYIDKVSKDVIQKDFEQDEKLFDKLVRLYTDEQTESKDGFTLRDLALQCAISHQKANIRDVSNIKQRHPSIAASLQHAGLCYQIQAYFGNHYHTHVQNNHNIFNNLDLQEKTKIAMESQLRQDVVPYSLYVCLVPPQAEIGTLGHPSTTYSKGCSLDYELLDLLSVNAKHRLLQVIYKMMLDSETGPRYQSNTGNTMTCVPPYVLDIVYKLLHSSPCSAELMVKEIFDKLRRCDKMIKMRHTGESHSGVVIQQLPEQTMRWLQTILQLMNHRLIRFLKYSSFASGLLHYIRFSLSFLENRQCYQTLESFAANVIKMQIDVKLLRCLDDPHREKPIWFAESEMLARLTVYSISRLIKIRGQADIKTEQIYRVLSSLYERRIEWSPEAMRYFPSAVRSFYETENKNIAPRPAVSTQKIQQLTAHNKSFMEYVLQGSSEPEAIILQHFSTLENQPDILCALWIVALSRNSADCFHMASCRNLLMLIPPARMSTYVIDLIDFILSIELPANSTPFLHSLLDAFIWKHQWINFNHVIFALTKGGGTPEHHAKAMTYLKYLLLESPEFQKRVDKWVSLKISTRSWREDDYHDKLMQYLQEFPEYHEFEVFAMRQFEPTAELPNQQLKLPIYYTNVISNFISSMENLIMHLIEYLQKDLLIVILDKFGHLFYQHQCPLAFVTNLLLYYYPSETLRSPPVLKRILRLLDFDQYPILAEARAYAENDADDDKIFNAEYFEKIIHKLAGSLNPKRCAPRTNPQLPERHFREIGSPAVEGLSVATLEIMITPVPPSTIVRHLLNLALLRESHHVGCSALSLHAIGLLLPMLPQQEFIRPIFTELIELIETDPYLLEISEPCRLIRCGIPKSINGYYAMQQTLPDLTTTSVLRDEMSTRLCKAMIHPYIFNDYTFNLHNYTTNAPNSFLCLFHSIIHYSSLDIFSIFLEYIQKLRMSGRCKTDVQLLYICFLIGPALHRIEKLDTSDAGFLIELMHLVKQVTSTLDMKDGWTTQALEQVYDFLHHIRTRFVKSNELTTQIRDIIRSMNPPIAQRLLRLIYDKNVEG